MESLSSECVDEIWHIESIRKDRGDGGKALIRMNGEFNLVAFDCKEVDSIRGKFVGI